MLVTDLLNSRSPSSDGASGVRGSPRAPPDIEDLVIAGWTGRDVAALNHHIEELKAIGVQPPSSVPLYYRAVAALLTQADTIQVLGDDSSGEVEPVLVGTPRAALGHGRRRSHRPQGRELRRRRLQADLREAGRPHRLALRGHRAALGPAHAAQLRDRRRARRCSTRKDRWPISARRAIGRAAGATATSACRRAWRCSAAPCGAIGGIRPSPRFEMELEDPVLGRKLAHGYDVAEPAHHLVWARVTPIA